MTRVLFLCTGNYFRSRFSEALFQHLISDDQADGRLEVASAGLKVTADSGNVGPMAAEAITAVRERDIVIDPNQLAMPRQVEDADLSAADVVVAVDAAAHRPMVRERYPAWEDRIRFWAVKDLGEEEGGDPISQLDANVRELFEELNSAVPR